MAAGMQLVFEIARRDETLHAAAEQLFKTELAVHNLDYLRVDLHLDLGVRAVDARMCSEALAAFGPHLPWDQSFLQRRVWCYTFGHHPELAAAEADLAAFLADAGQSIGDGLAPPTSASATANASAPPQPSTRAAPSAAQLSATATPSGPQPSATAAASGNP